MKGVYVFHGADRKSGVTMLAQSVAEMIAAEATEEKILFVSMCGRKNAQYFREPAESIGFCRSRLESGLPILRSDIGNTSYLRNLSVLCGIQKESEVRSWMPDLAGQMLREFRREFRVVIADTGSELASGLAVGSLAEADETYFVLSQNEAAVHRYEQEMQVYRDAGIQWNGIVLNQYSEQDPYTADYIGKRLKADGEKQYSVRMSAHGRRAEMEYKTLAAIGERRVVKDIQRIAWDFMRTAEIVQGEEKRKRKWKNFVWKSI